MRSPLSCLACLAAFVASHVGSPDWHGLLTLAPSQCRTTLDCRQVKAHTRVHTATHEKGCHSPCALVVCPCRPIAVVATCTCALVMCRTSGMHCAVHFLCCVFVVLVLCRLCLGAPLPSSQPLLLNCPADRRQRVATTRHQEHRVGLTTCTRQGKAQTAACAVLLWSAVLCSSGGCDGGIQNAWTYCRTYRVPAWAAVLELWHCCATGSACSALGVLHAQTRLTGRNHAGWQRSCGFGGGSSGGGGGTTQYSREAGGLSCCALTSCPLACMLTHERFRLGLHAICLLRV